MRYVELIQRHINGHIKNTDTTPSSRHYFSRDLFLQLKPNIELVAGLEGLPVVDKEKLFEYFENATSEWLSNNPIEIEPASSLDREGYTSWLTEERNEQIDWNYTDRYIRLLEKKGRAEDIIKSVKASTYDILGKIGDPQSTAFYCKGLVVGNVQSGKTENFNGVINRAIDAGYRLVIVLSGIMEDLRRQTQKRLESDVVGEGILDERTNTSGQKGVGDITNFFQRKDLNVEPINSITSYKSDFSKSLADANFNVKFLNVLVCKKNISILKNLLLWLQDNPGCKRIPLLLIDDEADNASLNNLGAKGREYASKVNGYIRALLALFECKTYLGYTATPFANVLQDRNEAPQINLIIKTKINRALTEREFSQVPNIFPDDFIVLLNSPSNYVGAKHIFETLEPLNNKSGQKLPLFVKIRDALEAFPSRLWENDDYELVGIPNYKSREEFDSSDLVRTFGNWSTYRSETNPSTRNDDFPRALPKSLKDAVACFIISIAIRDYRRPHMQHSKFFNQHNTMLVHVSRFITWQNRTKKLIIDYHSDIQRALLSDNPKSDDSIYSYFETIWYRYYAEIIEDISTHLPEGYDDPYMAPLSFSAIKNRLLDAIDGVEIKALNSSREGDKLTYEAQTPQKVIVVGGNRLSRGFTLEGLTINYFCRETNYSDTLLQMGRWFGYRLGYLDCCKIFTTEDAIERFDLTTKTIEELEGEFRKMEHLRKTPSNFVLRVRKHPNTLKITRPSILKNAVTVQWSYQDSLEQTYKIDVSKGALNEGWETFQNYIVKDRRFLPGLNQGFMVAEKTDAVDITSIITKIKNFDKDTRNAIVRYIKLCNKQPSRKLINWTIAVKATGRGQLLDKSISGLPDNLKMAVRKGPSAKDNLREDFIKKRKFRTSGRSANFISQKDLSILLTDDEIRIVEESYRREKKENLLRKHTDWTEAQAEDKAQETSIPERVYREQIPETDGVLLIYLIDPKEVFLRSDDGSDTELREIAEEEQIDLNKPIVGYALGIPPIEDDPSGDYLQGDNGIPEEEEQLEDEDSELPEDRLSDNEI